MNDLRSWQTRLLPFMTGGIAILAVLFFIGTFWNYAALHDRLEQQDPDIVASIEKLRQTSPTPSADYQDWYMRVVLEERAMRSRHHQNAAVIESRVWTRFMGFITGMVMVMAGCIFILGKLDAEFDGGLKGSGYEGVLKTNSPGLVLAVVGSVLIAISLVVSVNIEVTDKPVYIADLTAQAIPTEHMPKPRPLETVEPPASAASPVDKAASKPKPGPMPPELAAEICKQAGKPPGCLP